MPSIKLFLLFLLVLTQFGCGVGKKLAKPDCIDYAWLEGGWVLTNSRIVGRHKHSFKLELCQLNYPAIAFTADGKVIFSTLNGEKVGLYTVVDCKKINVTVEGREYKLKFRFKKTLYNKKVTNNFTIEQKFKSSNGKIKTYLDFRRAKPKSKKK